MVWLAASRLPVGSSASKMGGLLIRARAMQTRCCSPPESSLGRWWMREPRPTRSRAVLASVLVGHGVEVLGEHDVLYGREVGDEVELLEDEADLVGAEAVELGGGHGGYVDVVDFE